MGGQVLVAKAKPSGIDAVSGKFVFCGESFAFASPTAFGTDAAAEGVHHGVKIWADPHAVHPNIVTSVCDYGDVYFPGHLF